MSKTNDEKYSAALYERFVKNSELRQTQIGADAEREIKLLYEAGLSEAFLLLTDIVDELKKRGVAFKPNGAINTSRLARLAGITNVEIQDSEYFFSRFVNPYSNKILSPRYLCTSLDVEPREEREIIKFIYDFYSERGADNTLLYVCSWNDEPSMEIHNKARENGNALLDITIYPSEEFSQYVTLKKFGRTDDKISAAELCEYIQTTPIRVFEKAEAYRKILSVIKPHKLERCIEEGVALALALVNSGMEELADKIRDYKDRGCTSLRPDDIAAVFIDTCDLFVYQEQAMRVLCDLSGCSEFYADNIRRCMAMRKSVVIDEFEQEFLFGGKEANGAEFCGCLGNDKMVAGRNYWAEMRECMPTLYLKSHVLSNVKIFIECAKLQMCQNGRR